MPVWRKYTTAAKDNNSNLHEFGKFAQNGLIIRKICGNGFKYWKLSVCL